MQTKGYKSVEEWEIDRKKLHSNPKDRALIEKIVRKTDSSSKMVIDKIQEILEFEVLDQNPDEFIDIFVRRMPKETYLILNSNKNPWFSC